MTTPIALVCASLVTTASFAANTYTLTYTAGANGTITGGMVARRSGQIVTLLPGGKVLIAGGNNDGGFLSSAELYDPAAATFFLTGDLATARTGASAIVLHNGTVLIAGGWNDSGSQDTAELYDPDAGTFTATGSLATSRSNATATLLPDGKVLIVGGYNSNSSDSEATVELYDPVDGTFTATGLLTTSRSGHTATLIDNGKVLVAGGWNRSSGNLNSAELYDRATGHFTPTGSLATARSQHTASPLPNGMVLLVGGNGSSGSQTSAELYDPATGNFTATDSLATARSYHTATALPNGQVLIAGGMGTNGFVGSAELYDPATSTFNGTASLATARAQHTATLLPNGLVLITGGQTNLDYLRSAELYDSTAGSFTATGSLATARSSHVAVLLPDRTVVIAGGNNSSYLNSAELCGVPNGTIHGVSPQTVDYNGSGTAVSAIPVTGYRFFSWSDGATANPRTDSNVTADITVMANFAAEAADLTITKTHTRDFKQGDTGDTYTITVANSGSASTSGPVTVSDALPTGLTPTAPAGTADGWSCSISGQTMSCTRSDALEAGETYPAITLAVNVAINAPASVTNTATVSGGGEVNTGNDSASDPTTVTPNVPGAPANVVAIATSASQVSINWSAVPTGVSYQIFRKSGDCSYNLVGAVTDTSYLDSGLTANTTYLYQVKAIDGASNVSGPSETDLATTILFTDDLLNAGSTVIRAVHLTELRMAVNAVRVAAGLTTAPFTDASTSGVSINAVHVIELQSALNEARVVLGVSAIGFNDPAPVANNLVEAAHFQQLRLGVK